MRSLLAFVCVAALGTLSLAEEKKDEVNAYSFTMNSLDGKKTDLGKYKGKLVLAVNVASRCGYTPQYTGLQELHEKYKDKGLVVLGIPCNQFGRQEPGSSNEIAEFCSTEYGVSFEMLEKVDVNGDDACDLFKFLTAQENDKTEKGNVKWNFEKYLIGPDGNVVARFRSRTKPNDKELIDLIETQLAALKK